MKTTWWKAEEPGAVEQAGKLLREGGLVAIPTETVYGLAANAWDSTAVEGIFAAKGRPQDNPLIIHIARESQVQELAAAVPALAQKLFQAFWPGPLNRCPAQNPAGFPARLAGNLPTVAVRFPSHPVAQAVIQAAGSSFGCPFRQSFRPAKSDQCPACLGGFIRPDCRDSGRREAALSGWNPRWFLWRRTRRACCVRAALPWNSCGPLSAKWMSIRRYCPPLQKETAASSPGMKYQHYAPLARVILVEGPYAAYRDFVNSHAGPGVAALCYEGEQEGLRTDTVCFGREQDASGQARALFDALRQLDARGIRIAYARCPRQEGIGLAVYNRLLRAAGFEVIHIG